MIEEGRLLNAYQQARADLLGRRVGGGHWAGWLSSSALSTATAVSALALVARHTSDPTRRDACREVAARGLAWLRGQQNDDGGFGDTDRSLSNIATTMLVRAAFELAGPADDDGQLLARAERYIDAGGGVGGLRRRYGADKTFAVPILTNYALAGLVSWREVDPLPFELGALPHTALRLMRLPVVSYAVPALVAIGLARYFHRRPRNPATLVLRRAAVWPAMRALGRMQPASGGYLEATPLTSFVVMSLASVRRVDHPVARRGTAFLLGSVRDDGSWPIDTNLAAWNTTLAIGSLAAATGEVGALGCLDWLLSCQHRKPHPLTQAAPGGWGWSDLSGAVPDADDTAGALLALRIFFKSRTEQHRPQIQSAAADGVRWLLDLQNDDGGWPTFCPGWGALPFDRSGADLTAHAVRALATWREAEPADRVDEAIRRGFDYLARQQRPDGSWVPLWFGNQHREDEENPVYGTARVLLAYRDLDRLASPPAQRGLRWLVANRHPSGGWGGPVAWQSGGAAGETSGEVSSIEETAVALEALLAAAGDPALQTATDQGLGWLVDRVEAGGHREAAPIGFYFARLWYYEALYPLVFSVAALGHALRRTASAAQPTPASPTSGHPDSAS